MVRPPATSEAGAHAAGDTKSEHFEPARVRKLNEKQFSHLTQYQLARRHGVFGYPKQSATVSGGSFWN
jgi:hypothetical protein